MPSIFDVGSSALNSLQRAISTTGNNIANVNTDGYSRQLVEFSTRNPEYNGGFYLGSIGGSAARLAEQHIKKVEVLEYPELGMEAIWRIEVVDFPAFIVTDDKGNDFFASN